MITITPIPAFSDNYLWLISNGSNAVVVDPGDARTISLYISKRALRLVGILVTHHHADHTGGVLALKQKFNCQVWGPSNDRVAHLDHLCKQSDTFELSSLGLNVKVLSTPGHTLGHIAYFIPGSNGAPGALFCGDTLFSGGCGRLFEGSAEQMWHSMQKIMQLPEDTQIFPAHEYTLSNLEFALRVEPQNQKLLDYHKKVRDLRSNGVPSLPSNLALEKAINPFLRVDQGSVIEAASARTNRTLSAPHEVFAAIRQWKDNA